MLPTSVASVIVTNARVARVEALLGILSVLVPVTRAQLGKPRTQGSQGWGRRRSLREDPEGEWTSMSMDFDAMVAPSAALPMKTSEMTLAEATDQSNECQGLEKKRRCKKKDDCEWRDGECRLVAPSESLVLTAATSSVFPANAGQDDLVVFTL